MKKPTHEEIEKYVSKQDMCGLKEGDIIKIIRKAETYENGWNNSWDSAYMDQYVDQIGTITSITDYGIFVENLAVAFPYFILEKITSKKGDKQMETEILGMFKVLSKALKAQALLNAQLLERIDKLEQQQLRTLDILSGK